MLDALRLFYKVIRKGLQVVAKAMYEYIHSTREAVCNRCTTCKGLDCPVYSKILFDSWQKSTSREPNKPPEKEE